ncbi:MAG: alpha/beta fold hydrolase [Planctomycetes bacterium]|nr:alpha/beta fold hydrolase [Planctomycetota bacterium]
MTISGKAKYNLLRYLLGIPVLLVVALIVFSCASRGAVEREAASCERSPETGIIKGAEPFFIERGPRACLLIHGFTSSPAEVRELGERLAEAGFSVSCPLLPGHGTRPDDLETVTWRDWYHAVESEYLKLKQGHETVSVAGISMGAALALQLAREHHPHKLVLLSPYYRVTYKWYYLLPPEAYVDAGAFLFRYVNKMGRLMLNDKTAWKNHIAYNHVPTKAIQNLMALGRAVADAPPEVRTPTLIIHARHDDAAAPEGAQAIHDALGSEEKRLVWLDNSNHIITLDYDKEIVNQAVLDFLKE